MESNSVFISKQSPETKPPQFCKINLLNWLLLTKVIIINVVIGGFSGEDLK